MPLYNVPQAGGTLTTLIPGDRGFLFTGAETPSAGVASVAIARGPSPSGCDAGITFQILFGSAPTAAVEIQASNVDTDADYETVYTSTNVQRDNYSDTPPTRWAFYRAKLSTYSAGGMPIVKVQR